MRYLAPTLTWGRVQIRTLQVISPRRTPSRSRLVNVMKRVYENTSPLAKSLYRKRESKSSIILLARYLTELARGTHTDPVPITERPDHGDDGQCSDQDGREKQHGRRGRMIDQNDPKNQLAHKDTAPNSGNQAMRNNNFTNLP